MALVVLFSTMSCSVNQHFCGDTLVSTSFFTKAKDCGMDMQTSLCRDCSTTTKDCSIIKKNCCRNKQILLEGQNDLEIPPRGISFHQYIFVTVFFYAYVNLFEELEQNITFFEGHSPPLLIKDIQKLDEVYII